MKESDGLDVGSIATPRTLHQFHRIRIRAKTTTGSCGAPGEFTYCSDYSDSIVVALGSVPTAPTPPPTKDDAASGAEEIAVTWSQITGNTLPVFGYKLYSDLGTEQDFVLVYDGHNKPTETAYTLTNVTDPLVAYGFYVTGINFNGEGAASGIARLRSCTTPSSGAENAESFAAPVIDSVSKTTIVISWTAPRDDGGCKILGYAIYIADSTSLTY